MRRLGIVVARKGSSRLAGKNRQDLHGRPLYRWTVDAALATGLFDPLLVSTDDPLILEQCAGLPGVLAEARPEALCTARATALEVLAWALPRLAERFGPAGAFCLLQPTSPFRGAGDIRRVLAALDAPGVEFAVGVAPFASPPFFALALGGGGDAGSGGPGVHPVHEGALTRVTRTQDAPALFHPAGGIFAGRPGAFLRQGHFYGPTSRGVVMDHFAAWDINTPEDMDFARALAPAVLARAGEGA